MRARTGMLKRLQRELRKEILVWIKAYTTDGYVPESYVATFVVAYNDLADVTKVGPGVRAFMFNVVNKHTLKHGIQSNFFGHVRSYTDALTHISNGHNGFYGYAYY